MTERNLRLYYLALFLAVSVFVLLMAGGAVTSHEAGLAVPDWPLSYGMLFPPMVGNIFWEHGHRMIAGFVAVLTLITAISIQMGERRRWLRRLAWIAFVTVIVQAVLGGITVLMLLPAPVSIAHACLGQTFFCLVIAMAYYLSPLSARPAAPGGEEEKRLRRLTLLTAAFVYLQLLLGATVRHTGEGVMWHVLVAFFILVHVVLLLVRIARFHGDLKYLLYPAVALGFLTVVQIFLGIGSFVYTMMLERGPAPPAAEVLFTVSHQSTGAVILGLTVFLALAARPSPFETSGGGKS